MQKSFGQVAYEASVKTFDESDVGFGEWSDMDEGVKELWGDVAGAVLDEAALRLRATAEMEDIARSERMDQHGVSISTKTLGRREAAEFLHSIKSS